MSRSSKVTRRAVLAGATGMTAAGLAPPVAAAAGSARRAAAVPAGVSVVAETIGRIVQEGLVLTGFGYVTRLKGVATGDLFRGAHTEAGARFTYTAKATAQEHFVVGAVRSTTAVGTLDLYADPDGANFADPASFANGTRIASFAVRIQNTLSVIAPDQAVTDVWGELRQTRAAPFTAGGKRRRLGQRGDRLLMSSTGPGTRTDPTIPRATFDVAGRLTTA